jgi:hypothetical protein
MKSIALVGNAPTDKNYTDDIDAADWVVRFNKTRHLGTRYGRKLDDLFLINVGGQAHEWVRDQTFWRRRAVRSATVVSLPIAPTLLDYLGGQLWRYQYGSARVRDSLNFTKQYLRRFSASKKVRILPNHVRLAALQLVAGNTRQHDVTHWPSTGFLALQWYYHHLAPNASIDLYGFSFAGWDGHHWERERDWVMRTLRSDSRLRWHNPS